MSQNKAQSSLSSKIVPMVPSKGIKLENTYFHLGLKGTSRIMFIREAVWERILELPNLLGEHYGVLIYDGFRSVETQTSIFDSFFEAIKLKNPDLSFEDLLIETKKFVAHPLDKGRFEISPHNSGGAIDLTLTYKDVPLNMGTSFDDLTEKAETLFFEKDYLDSLEFSHSTWIEIRSNRRLLLKTMEILGFTNYPGEWWHYDLGNCLWSLHTGNPWVFDSAESEITGLVI